jgi:hypothetical protein
MSPKEASSDLRTIVDAEERHIQALSRVNDALLRSWRKAGTERDEWRAVSERWRGRWAWTFGLLLVIVAWEINSRLLYWLFN